ncbi:hypothetical protein [Streptomyces sp. NPDC097619]|uniref:hypothetical protein n=1 Tax=Streptomyces sp. NPDC097619 TaxID=3157228 RepID=UPI003326519E
MGMEVCVSCDRNGPVPEVRAGGRPPGPVAIADVLEEVLDAADAAYREHVRRTAHRGRW